MPSGGSVELDAAVYLLLQFDLPQTMLGSYSS